MAIAFSAKPAVRAALLAAAILTAVPATATITLVKQSAFQGEILLIGAQTGTTVIGTTNHSGIEWAYNAYGTELVGNGGQAKVTGIYNLATSNPNDTVEITSLQMFRPDGGFVNDLEFNLFGGSATSVSFIITDNLGAVFNFNDEALGNGSNFFGFRGLDGQSIARVALSFSRGGIEDVRQLRFDPVVDAAIPEPATWALLLCGFGIVGVSMRGRRRHMVAA